MNNPINNTFIIFIYIFCIITFELTGQFLWKSYYIKDNLNKLSSNPITKLLTNLTKKNLTNKNLTSKNLTNKNLTSKNLTSKNLTSKNLTNKNLLIILGIFFYTLSGIFVFKLLKYGDLTTINIIYHIIYFTGLFLVGYYLLDEKFNIKKLLASCIGLISIILFII